jgi:molybdenum cofactor biosynthesis protein B
MTRHSHDARRPVAVACGVVTASDTRTAATDTSGALIEQLLTEAGHRLVARTVVPDEPAAIVAAVDDLLDRGGRAILINGGTGIAPRDRTFDAVSSLVERPLPGFGELFRMLSYQEIGSAAMLSRATAGIYRSGLLVSMPGSRAAVALAMERLVLPELGHVSSELRWDSM